MSAIEDLIEALNSAATHQRGGLIFARDGKLFHWEPPDRLREIADFNSQSPEPEPSPPEARQWLERPAERT